MAAEAATESKQGEGGGGQVETNDFKPYINEVWYCNDCYNVLGVFLYCSHGISGLAVIESERPDAGR